MQSLNRLFFKGLLVLLPVTLSLYLILWIGIQAEGFFGGIFKSTLGESFYLPGFGIIITFIFIIIVGALVSNYLTRRFVNFFIDRFEQFPLVKTVYKPIKDLILLFGADEANKSLKRVVLFKHNGLKMLGLVTRDEFNDLPKGTLSSDHIAVYIPMGYMIGGFTVFVARHQVEQVDIPVERALKLSMTAFIKLDDLSAAAEEHRS